MRSNEGIVPEARYNAITGKCSLAKCGICFMVRRPCTIVPDCTCNAVRKAYSYGVRKGVELTTASIKDALEQYKEMDLHDNIKDATL